jgi:ABC-2 type transport system permease protein
MTAVSGISYPLASQALHLQLIGWILPLYWLGLGMRSAMLPGGVAVTEIGDSWRSAETAAVLGLWAVVATALARVALREMSHRAAGSRPRAGERDRTAR